MPGKVKSKKQVKPRNIARSVASSKGQPMKERAIAGLRCIIDPHTNISVYDMGLIADLRATQELVSLTFRPTSPFCPLATQLAMNIKRSMGSLEGVRDVCVTVVGHYQEDNINRYLVDSDDGTPKKARSKK